MTINYFNEIQGLGLTGGVQKGGKPDVFYNCCFHSGDNTPSLSINVENGLYRCFACGVTGNFYTLVCHLKSKEYYFEKYGDKQDVVFKDNMFSIQNKNKNIKVNEEVLSSYRFLHGWVLNRFDNDKELLKRFEIGFDKNRNAITTPLRDENGSFYNVEYRHLSGEGKASYLYDFNKKGDILFNLNNTKNNNEVFLVEGAFDALRLIQFGYENVVAFLGTELTPARIELLNKYFSIINLSFDDDLAGKKISKQLIETFSGKKELYFLDYSLVGKNDPGECNKEEVDKVMLNKKYII